MIEEFEYEYEGEEIEYYAIRPNKTQLKKDIAALFALGEEMSELSNTQLKLLDLPEPLFKSVTEVSGMAHNGARKRLLKFIAGQLHKMDTQPLLEKMARLKNKSVHAVREHHIAERWRDQLINEGMPALTELLDEHPHADRQQLRQLIRNAQKETESGKPPKSSRLLYRYLKALLNDQNEETDTEEDFLDSDIDSDED